MEQENLEAIKARMYARLLSWEPRQIAHQDIEGLRALIGIELPLRRAHNMEGTMSGTRKCITGIGDPNPLYYYPDYADKTRWGGVIAHPTYINTCGTSVKRELDPTDVPKGLGAMDGMYALDGGLDLYFYRPIRIGDFIWGKKYLMDVTPKKSEFAGLSVVTNERSFWANDNSELLAGGTRTTVYVAWEKTPGERTKYSWVKDRIRYKPEDFRPVDNIMDAQVVRGAEPRYWEDVNEGDELQPVGKGPVIYVDLFNFNIGHGMTWYDGSHLLMYHDRLKHPGRWVIDLNGCPNSVEAVHFHDGMLATRLGMPTEFIYGDLICSWLVHLCTNWMGDDAWLYHIDARYHEPVWMYDHNVVKGKVIRKYIDGAGQYKVDVDMHTESNRGRTCATGHATIILPSKVGGLPQVPPVNTPAPFKPEEAEVPTGDRTSP